MAQARGAIATGTRGRRTVARLKEMPWAALIVLILVLIVILAMWEQVAAWGTPATSGACGNCRWSANRVTEFRNRPRFNRRFLQR